MMSDVLDRTTLVAVDLFAGGGGLTLGLKQAGFIVSAAVEYSKPACQTYKTNHPETVLFCNDIQNVTGSELISTSPTGCIDLIAACPPCQGFSSLTLKYKKNDSRNELINQFARLVKEVMPKTLMMENVPGLITKGANLFDPVVEGLQALGYQITYKVLNVADYGVPQSRRRLVLLGSLTNKLEIPQPTHSENALNNLPHWNTVRDALSGVPSPITMLETKALGGPKKNGWNVVRDLAKQNISRLRASKSGESRLNIPNDLRPKCHQNNEGFSNVYGRMSWDKPSPTITGGCTSISKGRFGHPSELRTISVKEAALLQTFPMNYVFDTDIMKTACTIIGNALPPAFAKIMAEVCAHDIQEKSNVRTHS